jgi:hypothetical protein
VGGAQSWDPATTGGLASIGIVGFPLGPLVLWFILVGLVVALRHRLGGGSLGGPRGWVAAARRTVRREGRTIARTRMGAAPGART